VRGGREGRRGGRKGRRGLTGTMASTAVLRSPDWCAKRREMAAVASMVYGLREAEEAKALGCDDNDDARRAARRGRVSGTQAGTSAWHLATGSSLCLCSVLVGGYAVRE
jgi:hypothetical protein